MEDDWFEAGIESGWIEMYEREMLRFIEKEYGGFDDEIRLCLVFLSLFIRAGHTCLPLDRTPQEWMEILALDIQNPSIRTSVKTNLKNLSTSQLVGPEGEMKPLIFSGNRLTFRRYWFYEFTVSQWIKRNISKYNRIGISDIPVEILNNFFQSSPDEINWQKVAATLSLIKSFLIISGGPGTGKTTTVARILALHQRLSEKQLKIALAAPTGKAAGRIGEALHKELGKLGLSQKELRNFPKEAKTVHRLLSGLESPGLLPPAEKKKLRHDLIIIDEASMMDLSLMYRLIDHLSDHTQLILLGDKDQLASVEAGSVFADLCKKEKNEFLPETIHELKKIGISGDLPSSHKSKIGDSIVYLTRSYRFDKASGIGRLSGIVKYQNRENENLVSVFQQFDELEHKPFHYQKEDLQKLLRDLKFKIQTCKEAETAAELLSFWKQSIWLMVLRRGLTGTDRMNRLLEERLAADRIVRSENGWYHGRPIMITQNDYSLGVFNGDLGVTLRDENDSTWVYVESGSEIKRFKPQRLNHYDPAYFLTVHKSQGSEFDHVNFLLPQSDTPILTKELIYTAITRSKSKFSLYGSLDLFEKGIQRETVRFTGLKEMLYDS